jgi:hypothetical protein
MALHSSASSVGLQSPPIFLSSRASFHTHPHFVPLAGKSSQASGGKLLAQVEKFLFDEDDPSTRPEFHLFANTLYCFLDR